MKALIVYATLIIIGTAICVATGLYVEKQVSSAVSLIVFLSMYFANYAVCWILTILIMDGSLKNAQGRQDQREAENIGKAAMKIAREKRAA